MSIASVPQSRAVKTKSDAVLAGAVNQAREAAVLDAEHASHVGAHLGMTMVGERLAAHTFACTMRGYVGWQWTVTVARVPRGRVATVCEVHLLPTEDAILAPQWLPWAQRLQPGDIGPGDVLPFKMDDPRLVEGYKATGNLEEDQVAIEELALERARILSETGRDEAAKRWFEGENGPRSAGSLQSAGSCGGCGFLVPLQGALGQVFGVCANVWSNDDGKVVAIGHGCGAHSETDVAHRASDWPDNHPIIDETALETVSPEQLAALPPLHADRAPANDTQVEPALKSTTMTGPEQATNQSGVLDGGKQSTNEILGETDSDLHNPESDSAAVDGSPQAAGESTPNAKRGKNTRRKNTRQRNRKFDVNDHSFDSAPDSVEQEAVEQPTDSTVQATRESSSDESSLNLELPAVNQANLVKIDREEALHNLDIIAKSLPQR